MNVHAAWRSPPGDRRPADGDPPAMRLPGLRRAPVAPPAHSAVAGTSRRLGYDASADDTARRVVPMLRAEPVVWLSTVRPDGVPHIVPTWFWWDGEALLVLSKPDAVKVRNLRANPRLMVALGNPADDFAVGLIEAEARLDDRPAEVPDAFFDKYHHALPGGALDRETYRATYTQAIRVVPTRFLAWRGRGAAHDAVAGGRDGAAVTIAPAGAAGATGGRGSMLPAWA